MDSEKKLLFMVTMRKKYTKKIIKKTFKILLIFGHLEKNTNQAFYKYWAAGMENKDLG